MLDLQKIKAYKNDRVGFFRFKKFDSETYLITNDIGKFSFLSKKDFGALISNAEVSSEKEQELLEKGFLKDEQYELKMKYDYAQKNQFLAFWPSLHIIVTTLRCNHKCEYCHAAVAPMTAREMDMTIETAKKVVDTIFYTSSIHLTIEFQWGESLVNWDVVKFIVEYARPKAIALGKKLRFALVTNLSLMDEEKMLYLIENDVSISTSLDGDEETHNFNRTFKDGNSYEKVTYWIKRISQEYKKRQSNNTVWALLTVTKKTLPKYKEVIDTYVWLGLKSIFLRPLNPYGFAAKELDVLWYSPEEFFDFYKKSLQYIFELNEKGANISESLTSIYLGKIFSPVDPNYLDERSPCWACIGQVAYNYDGKVYSCDEGRMFARMWDFNFLMTDLKETGRETYEAMINSDTTKVMVQASTLDGLPGYNESVYKPYIWVCPIHSYKTSGNLIPTYAKDHKRILDYAILDYIFEHLRNEKYEKIMRSWIEWRSESEVISQCEAY